MNATKENERVVERAWLVARTKPFLLDQVAVKSLQANSRGPQRNEKVSETSNQLISPPVPWFAPIHGH